MPRLMSVKLTEQAVVEQRKTVTRRLGWEFLKPGDRLTLCRKVQGRRRKDGTVEPLVRLTEVEVVSVRQERLDAITDSEVRLEGLAAKPHSPGWAAAAFVDFFCEHMGCTPQSLVTRIEWRYLDDTTGRAA